MQLIIHCPLSSFLITPDQDDASASMVQDSTDRSLDACIRRRIDLQGKTKEAEAFIGSHLSASHQAQRLDDLTVSFILDELTNDEDVKKLVLSWLLAENKAMLKSHQCMANPNALDFDGGGGGPFCPSVQFQRCLPEAGAKVLPHTVTPGLQSPREFPSSANQATSEPTTCIPEQGGYAPSFGIIYKVGCKARRSADADTSNLPP
ncbi:hypothetical protein AK830_g7209 [Neonectria ditissima]|uniref:Uncharacterized protein n=1 Tax=Neonectria ditissima TaxID=78410 RepID=A0A0P7AXP0_9HYPO|nr:hypothetical protein AK830_g7209 [Neonectria ditissima]